MSVSDFGASLLEGDKLFIQVGLTLIILTLVVGEKAAPHKQEG
jgi:hypothetical protein